jgi:hypothetical protein
MQFGETKREVKDARGRNHMKTAELNIYNLTHAE